VQTVIDAELLGFHQWHFYFRPAGVESSRLMVLIHGWTGDENSMWFFTRILSPYLAVLSPRGLYPAPEGGYSWREILPGTWGMPRFDELSPSAHALVAFIDEWSFTAGVKADQIDLIGFSQGTALSYVLALLYPRRIRRVAALSGFMPSGAEALYKEGLLAGKSFFVAHGKQDDKISVEQARRCVSSLKELDARIRWWSQSQQGMFT
jgi:phospholipase/carboxylesterase